MVIKGDNENGAAVHIDADQNALSVVDIDAGEFNLTSSAATVVVAGAASSITTSAGDLTLTADADNSQVVIKGDQENGTAVHIDGDAVAASVVDIDAGILDVDVTGAANIATTGIAGDIAIVSAHTAGVAFHLDADADAASEVDIDAGILDINVTDAATLDATTLTITSSSGTKNVGTMTVQGAGDAGVAELFLTADEVATDNADKWKLQVADGLANNTLVM